MALVKIVAQADPSTSLSTELDGSLAQARQVIVDSNTYIAIVSPSNAQVAAQVKLLTQQMKGVARIVVALIRLVIKKLDSTS